MARAWLSLGLLLGMPMPAEGQVWDGGAAPSTNWNAAGNWDVNAVPVSGSNVLINNATLTNQPTLNVASAALNQTTVSAGTLTVDNVLTSTLVLVNSDGNLIVNVGDTILGTVQKAGSGTITNNGTISGTLSVNGGQFNNAGAVSGTTSVSGGTLNLNAGSNLANAASFTVNDGTVNVNTSETVGSLSGTGGAIAIGVAAALTVNQSADGSYAGGISGTGTLNKAGAAALTLTGNSTHGGVANVNAGSLIVVGTGSLGAASINVASGAELQVDGASLATGAAVSNAGVFVIDGSESIGRLTTIAGSGAAINGSVLRLNAGTSALGGTITGTGGLTVAGTAVADINVGLGYTGATTVLTGGRLELNGSNRLADASTVVVNGGIFDLNVSSDAVGGVQLLGGAVEGSGTLSSTTRFAVQSGSVSAGLGGLVGLDKTTAGTVSLVGANTYSGSTVVAAGTLNVVGAGSLLSTTNQLTGGTLNIDSGALPASATVSVGPSSTLGVAQTISLAGLTQSGGSVAANGTATVNIAGPYSQSGGTTSGTLDINPSTFTQSGGATIAPGTTVTVGGAQALQGGSIAGVLDGAGAVTVSGGTTLVTGRIDAASITIAGAGVLRAGGTSLAGGAALTVSNGTWEPTAPTMLQSLQVGAGGTVDFGTFTGSHRPLMVNSYAGGGTVQFNTFLGASGSPSDQLIVGSANVTGVTTVRVRNTTGLGAPTTGDGILLIEISGASPANAFALAAPGFVRVADYEYRLAKVGNNWYLQSQFVGLFSDGFEP